MGKLYFKYGTMNSGKSTQLICTAYSLSERNIPNIVIKSSIDTREEGVVHSRALGDMKCLTVTPSDNVCAVCFDEFVKKDDRNDDKPWDNSIEKWAFVDEAQFLTKEQVDQLANLVDFFGVNVVCYGLRTNFQTNLFEGSKRLMEIADVIEAIEPLGNRDIFNVRIDKAGRVVTEGEEIEVGAEDKYITMSRKNYNKIISEKSMKNKWQVNNH